MNQRETILSSKLQAVLHHLSRYDTQEDGTFDGTLSSVEDDTVLQKLYTHIDLMLCSSEYGHGWAEKVELMSFLMTVLDANIVNNPKNSGTVAFAIKVLASLIKTEGNVEVFSEDKILVQILIILPNIRNDPTLSSATLLLIEVIIKEKAGVHWLVKNGLWEKMLLPCLRSPSMFVQREGVIVIADVMYLLKDTQHFELMMKDLIMVANKFREIREQVNGTLAEEIRQSLLCVLSVFQQILTKTLGKEAVYSQLKNVADITHCLEYLIKNKAPVTSVTKATNVIILNLLHKFQEQLMSYGIFEQFLLDSLCTDLLALTKLLMDHGYIESFFRSSVNTHKYWMMMVNNLKEHKDIDLTPYETILIILTGFQVTPVVMLYRTSLKSMYANCTEKEKLIEKWNDELHSKMHIKEENKNETAKLEQQIQTILGNDSKDIIRFNVLCISAIISAAEHLHQTTAVTVFQGLSFLLFTHKNETAPMRHHAGLQRAVIDGLRILVEKFNINWRKSFVSVCLMAELCNLAKVPGLTTQVKVSILKAMNTCTNGFIPPVMSMLVNSERLENNSVEMMGQVLIILLGDMEWEVRDSALELLVTCTKLAKEKYPYFVEWLIRYKLNDAVLTALNDVEAYVRASALNVLANIIEIDQVWEKLENNNLPEGALTTVLREGEASVRYSAIVLVQALFTSGKYEEEMVKNMVIPIIQRAIEDIDNEIRLAAVTFIKVHIQAQLNKAGMVDGDFPSVTFSRGKIVKLDKSEVSSRVLQLITWVCECGYLTSLLSSLKDPSTAVANKGMEVLIFMNDLIKKYQVRSNFKFDGASSSHSEIKEEIENKSVVEVGGIPITLPEDAEALAEIDKTINDILSSSTLSAVSMIKRPANYQGGGSENISLTSAHMTADEVPQPNPAIPVSSLLQSIDELVQKGIQQEDQPDVYYLSSLLDDILLDGGQKTFHIDDQKLRDCY